MSPDAVPQVTVVGGTSGFPVSEQTRRAMAAARERGIRSPVFAAVQSSRDRPVPDVLIEAMRVAFERSRQR